MDTHLERVRFAGFAKRLEEMTYRAEQQEQSFKKRHALSLFAVSACGFVGIYILAVVPAIADWLDKTPPLVQFVVPMIPLAVFGIWRLRKMSQ